MERKLDGFSVVPDRDGKWDYMAVRGSQYVIFDDGKIKEGWANIGRKWNFLPERFASDLHAIAVSSDKNTGGWNYVFIKGTEYVIFNDGGIKEGPKNMVDKWPFLQLKTPALTASE